MTALTRRLDQVIADMGRLSRRAAFAALEEAFAMAKAQPGLSEEEVQRFFDLVTLVLLLYPRNMTIRITSARHRSARDERLRFDAYYEVALSRTLDFLSRNFLNHLEEYQPQEYLRACLRTLAKEYGIERRQESEEQQSVADADDRRSVDEPVAEESPRYLRAYEVLNDADGAIFHDWFVGTLSRRELAQLYGITESEVERRLLAQAAEFDQGRLYPLVRWLVGLKEDGDILLLFSKGLTALQISQKVAKSHWLIYKRIAALRHQWQQGGARARAELARLCGVSAG